MEGVGGVLIGSGRVSNGVGVAVFLDVGQELVLQCFWAGFALFLESRCPNGMGGRSVSGRRSIMGVSMFLDGVRTGSGRVSKGMGVTVFLEVIQKFMFQCLA